MKLKQRYIAFYFVISLFSINSSADPMNGVLDLLDNGGGVISGKTNNDGYYIVALDFSSMGNEQKAHEDARLNALRKLNEMVNGITMSGSTHAEIKYATVNDEDGSHEFSSEKFHEIVNTQFKGHLSAVKQLKSGTYDGQYFVALVIAESDVQKISSLSSHRSQSSSHTTQIIVTDNSSNQTIADFNNGTKTVEAKGLASMRLGESKARKEALHDAIKNAVQQAQGVMMQSKSGRFNGALSLAISSKTEGYVSEYEILDEDIAKGEYYIIIDAIVDSGKLLKDVNFYTQILANPVFKVISENKNRAPWLNDELEKLGFAINDGKGSSTHTFYLKQSKRQIQDHKGSNGYQTGLSLTLKDDISGDILFTINNDALKTRSAVQPPFRAKQISEHIAYKQLQKKLGIEIIQSLAKVAENGINYLIELQNANRNDVEIFKNVLNNGTSGVVTNWEWNKEDKTMILTYRSSESLSQAFDQALNELYSQFKQEGKNRRPHMIRVERLTAKFKIVRGS